MREIVGKAIAALDCMFGNKEWGCFFPSSDARRCILERILKELERNGISFRDFAVALARAQGLELEPSDAMINFERLFRKEVIDRKRVTQILNFL